MHREYLESCRHPFFGHHHHWRRFFTEAEMKELKSRRKEKKIKWIERYKVSLENELKGVNEQLKTLKNEA